jgi:hypothetical protein
LVWGDVAVPWPSDVAHESADGYVFESRSFSTALASLTARPSLRALLPRLLVELPEPRAELVEQAIDLQAELELGEVVSSE